MPVKRRKRIVEALGLRRSMVGMLSMAVLVGMGERMAERFLPIYLIALGSSMFWPGLLNGLNDVLGALYAFPGGWLAERIGVKRSLLVFNLLAIAGFALVAAIPNWRAVVIGSFLFLSWSAISLPGTVASSPSPCPNRNTSWEYRCTRWCGGSPWPLARSSAVSSSTLGDQVTGVRVAFGAAIVMALVALVMEQDPDRGG